MIELGYSERVDKLRSEIVSNEGKLRALLDSMATTHPALPKLTIASHKGYYRVIEVSKSQASKADKCPDLIR